MWVFTSYVPIFYWNMLLCIWCLGLDCLPDVKVCMLTTHAVVCLVLEPWCGPTSIAMYFCILLANVVLCLA